MAKYIVAHEERKGPEGVFNRHNRYYIKKRIFGIFWIFYTGMFANRESAEYFIAFLEQKEELGDKALSAQQYFGSNKRYLELEKNPMKKIIF